MALDWTAQTHLKDNFAPVTDEVTVTDLAVEGVIPPFLDGLYVRNGPNPRDANSAHWFTGDGMLHGVRLKDGKAAWYRNRYIRTRQLDGESLLRPDFTVDHGVGAANTHIVSHAGRMLALVESSFPWEVNGELETVGVHDFGGRLKTGFTAHPKRCPVTGELHAFGYGFVPPYLTYHVIGADGVLIRSHTLDFDQSVMMHDFAMTARHVIFMDLPVVFNMGQAQSGGLPYQWDDGHGARLGIINRNDPEARVTWIAVDPCYVFHVANAFEGDDGSIIMDVVRYEDMWRRSNHDFTQGSLHRWHIDPARSRVADLPLDDLYLEFPRIDDRLSGLGHSVTYAASARPGAKDFTRIVKFEHATGRRRIHDFGPGETIGEFVFVPGDERCGEDEGWLMGFTHAAIAPGSPGGESALVVLDAQIPEAGPIARIPLGHRIPYGFHGNWIPS